MVQYKDYWCRGGYVFLAHHFDSAKVDSQRKSEQRNDYPASHLLDIDL
jgi:hypothetical protein